jgi:hypothetical protein
MFDVNNPSAGLVGWGDAQTGAPAFLQHRLVGTGTHAFIIDYPDGSHHDIARVFESDMRVSNDLWTNYLTAKKYNFFLYEIIGVTPEEVAHAMDKCKRKFLGDSYGYTEWLYFPYAMLCRKLPFVKDIRKQSNWFKNWLVAGVICTELWYWFMWYITELHPERWNKLRAILDQWSPDVLTANDVMHILQQNTDLFRLVFSYMNEEPKIETT